MTILDLFLLTLFTTLIFSQSVKLKNIFSKRKILVELLSEVVYFYMISSRLKNITILLLVYLLLI